MHGSAHAARPCGAALESNAASTVSARPFERSNHSNQREPSALDSPGSSSSCSPSASSGAGWRSSRCATSSIGDRDDGLLRVARRDVRPARRADRGGRAGAHLPRRHQRPDPVRDHAHPGRRREHAGAVPPPGVARGARRARRRGAHRLGGRSRPTGARPPRSPRSAIDAMATALFTDYALPFEILSLLLLAAIIGAIFLARRPEEDERANCDGPRGLPRRVDAPVRDRRLRLPGPSQRDPDADLHRADAERGEPVAGRLQRVPAPGRRRRRDLRPAGDGRGRGRGDGGAGAGHRHHPHPSDARGRRVLAT